MEKATESNVSNTGKTRNEWWRKRREEPRKVHAKITYETVTKRRQKSSARHKEERYANALRVFFSTKRLRDLLKKAAKIDAKTNGTGNLNKARERMGLKPEKHVNAAGFGLL